jgi:hypothetical protein
VNERSEKQAEAARRNGAHSQGPVSVEGKLRSSQNAFKHGMHSRLVVLQNENSDLYDQLHDQYMREWQPQGQRETDLVGDIVNARWRLNRLLSFETAGLDLQMDRQREEIKQAIPNCDEPGRAAIAFSALAEDTRALMTLSRFESRLLRTIERATARLERLLQHEKMKKRRNEPEL